MSRWWSDFDLKKPRKNAVYVWIVRFLSFFFFKKSNPGVQEPSPLAVPTPFNDQSGTASLTAAPHVLYCGRTGLHREAGRFPQSSASVSCSSLNSGINAES